MTGRVQSAAAQRVEKGPTTRLFRTDVLDMVEFGIAEQKGVRPQSRSPCAKIDFLVVQEVPLVEALEPIEQGPTDEEECANHLVRGSGGGPLPGKKMAGRYQMPNAPLEAKGSG